MVKRLQQILVDSYVGAIVIALLFTQVVSRIGNMLAMSATNWLIEGPFRVPMSPGFRILNPTADFVRVMFLLIVLVLLLYWLYFPSRERAEQAE